jgi:hypothetical protein
MGSVLGAMVSASVLLMVTLGGISINRIRHARRFRAVIDAYADKQIAQERKTKVSVQSWIRTPQRPQFLAGGASARQRRGRHAETARYRRG